MKIHYIGKTKTEAYCGNQAYVVTHIAGIVDCRRCKVRMNSDERQARVRKTVAKLGRELTIGESLRLKGHQT